jgi:hypothetical protein
MFIPDPGELVKKKFWADLQRIIELSSQKMIKLSKIWVWDPGSGIQDPGSGEKTLFWIPDPGPGVKKAPDPRSRIRNTAKKQ